MRLSKKNIPFIFLILTVISLIVCSFLSRSSIELIKNSLYTSPIMIALWAATAITALYSLLSQKLFSRNKPSFLIHLSLILILAGALTTHLTSTRGHISIPKGETVNFFYNSIEKARLQLPFSITLDDFEIIYYEGTNTPADYRSTLTIDKEGEKKTVTISMNKIYESDGYRIFQSSYTPDHLASSFIINYDRWGVNLTYTGYFLFLISMIALFFHSNSLFRSLLKNPLWKTFIIILVCSLPSQSKATAKTLSVADAKQFGELFIQHQDRISTIDAFATDFTKKLYGKSSYNGLSATQVLCGWIFNPQEWQYEPMIKIKDKEDQKLLGTTNMARFIDFFTADQKYKIQLAQIDCIRKNGDDAVMKRLKKLDEKAELIAMLENGNFMKIFPIIQNDKCRLVSPADSAISNIAKEDSLLLNHFFSLLYESYQKEEPCGEWIAKFKSYQLKQLGDAAPSVVQQKAEKLYLQFNYTAICSYITLTIGILAFILLCIHLYNPQKRWNDKPFFYFLIGCTLYLTFIIVLRSIVAERLPFSNGHETLLLIAWIAQFTALFSHHKFKIILPVGILISGFALLASSLSDMDPQITPLMPVLNSPLLSIHVSLMMISYTFAGFIALISIASLILHALKGENAAEERFMLLNQLLLYPTLFCMSIGIFIGSIWANVSWGDYWSWDPKETWALISMLIYAIPLHGTQIRFLNKPLYFHLYLSLALISILTTYFGVNYYFGGMHSYA